MKPDFHVNANELGVGTYLHVAYTFDCTGKVNKNGHHIHHEKTYNYTEIAVNVVEIVEEEIPITGVSVYICEEDGTLIVPFDTTQTLNVATLFTMDLYNKGKEVMTGKPASGTQLVAVGKVGVLVCAVIATVVAPFLDNPAFGGIFTFIQEFQGFLSPGVLAVFLFGFFVPKCPRIFGWLGILIGAVAYASFKWVSFLGCTDSSFLNRMGYSLIVVCAVGAILTIMNAIKGGEAVVLGDKGIIEMKTSNRAKFFGLAVIVATIALYILFW